MSAAPPLNPLLPMVLQLLRSAAGGISEYDLLKRLEQADAPFSTAAEDPDLVLFRKHFLLMNALYQLQETLWRDEQIWLAISPLRIALESDFELASSCSALSAASDAALRDYYLDWQQLGATDSAAVQDLLNGFWRRFHALDRRAAALAVLELDADADWLRIKHQYRRLAASSHPDRGGDGERFLQIRAAYETLRLALQRQ